MPSMMAANYVPHSNAVGQKSEVGQPGENLLANGNQLI